MLLIIFGHAQLGVFGQTQPGSVNCPSDTFYCTSIFPIAHYSIYAFHVPVFFFTSGILLQRQKKNKFSDFVRRDGKVLLLYLVWNLINALPAYFFSDLINRNFGRNGFWSAINPLKINGIMWFFVALFFAYAAHFLTVKYPRIRWVIIPAAITVLVLEFDFHGAAFGCLWLLTGAELERVYRMFDKKPSMALALPAFAIYVIATAISYWSGIHYTLAIPSCLAALATLYIIGANIPPFQLISIVARSTLSLYVMQIIAIAGTRIFLVKGLGFASTATLIPILTVAGVVFPLLALAAFRALRLSNILLLE